MCGLWQNCRSRGSEIGSLKAGGGANILVDSSVNINTSPKYMLQIGLTGLHYLDRVSDLLCFLLDSTSNLCNEKRLVHVNC
jgi:hypothetical protein